MFSKGKACCNWGKGKSATGTSGFWLNSFLTTKGTTTTTTTTSSASSNMEDCCQPSLSPSLIDSLHSGGGSDALEEYAHTKAISRQESIRQDELKAEYEKAVAAAHEEELARRRANEEKMKEEMKKPVALTMQTAPTSLLKRPSKEKAPNSNKPTKEINNDHLAMLASQSQDTTAVPIQSEEPLDSKRVYYSRLIQSDEPMSISTPAENKGITSTKA